MVEGAACVSLPAHARALSAHAGSSQRRATHNGLLEAVEPAEVLVQSLLHARRRHGRHLGRNGGGGVIKGDHRGGLGGSGGGGHLRCDSERYGCKHRTGAHAKACGRA